MKRLAALWAPERRWFVLAIVVAVLLRLAWVWWVGAVTPLEVRSDTGRNLEMARQFAHFQSYRLEGIETAFNAPGYSLLLFPAALVVRATGWFSLPIAAALLNVTAGGVTVAFGGVLAGMWFDRRARTIAAWILAVAAGPIYLTVVALTETVFTALVFAVLILVSKMVLGPTTVRRRTLVGLGALLAVTALVRPTGFALLFVVLAAVWVGRRGWRAAWRPALLVVGVMCLLVLPWGIRNGVRLGVWTPVSTNSAAFVCQGHGDHAKADVGDMTEEDFAYCFRQSSFDPIDHDEAEWAPRVTRRALAWAVRHPAEEVELTWDKTYATMVNDHQALSDARDGARRDIAGPDTLRTLDRLGEIWHRAVLVLGLLALLVLPAARRAWPLWVTAAGFVAVVWMGNALDRYHHVTMAVLAVLAAGLLARVHPLQMAGSATMAVGRASDRMRERRQVATEAVEAEPAAADVPVAAPPAVEEAEPAPPPPEEGLELAARPRSVVSGPYGRPLHPMIASVAIGAWVCAFGFDLVSQVADTAWVYARGAYVLVGVGVVIGVVAATIGLIDLVAIPRGTRAFQVGIRHLLCMDAALLLYAVSFLIRRTSEFRWHDGVELVPMGLSILGLGALAAGVWLGAKLSYRYGVRVALDPDRREGFEPLD